MTLPELIPFDTADNSIRYLSREQSTVKRYVLHITTQGSYSTPRVWEGQLQRLQEFQSAVEAADSAVHGACLRLCAQSAIV